MNPALVQTLDEGRPHARPVPVRAVGLLVFARAPAATLRTFPDTPERSPARRRQRPVLLAHALCRTAPETLFVRGKVEETAHARCTLTPAGWPTGPATKMFGSPSVHGAHAKFPSKGLLGMFEKIPPDRRIYLLFAIAIGAGAGYYLKLNEGAVVGGIAALGTVIVVLSAVGGGDLNNLLNAVRGAGDGMRAARPLARAPGDSALREHRCPRPASGALPRRERALQERRGPLQERRRSQPGGADRHRNELERLRSDLDAARRVQDSALREVDLLKSRQENAASEVRAAPTASPAWKPS